MTEDDVAETDATQHLEAVESGDGCVEVWEKLSERRKN